MGGKAPGIPRHQRIFIRKTDATGGEQQAAQGALADLRFAQQEDQFANVLAQRAVQEEAPRGGEAIVRLRDSFLSFKELEEHRARRRDRMLSAPAHEIKALISLVEAHAVYLIDEYAYLMRSREQSSSQNASLTA